MQRYHVHDIVDIAVIGAGPAALAVLHAANAHGLTAIAIDKGPVCSALLHHPTYMRWFSTTEKLELAGFPLMAAEKNPTRREYLQYCRNFVNYFALKIVTYHVVRSIGRGEDGLFSLLAHDIFGREYTWRAKNVVAATGFYDSPRPLTVPGETLPHVSHRFSEAHYYAGYDVTIIGGGSSAAEVALELYRAGARVTVVLRSGRFHTKYWIEPDIENRIREGSIICHRGATVTEIFPDAVRILTRDQQPFDVPADFVLAMTGYEPDTRLLESAGAQIDHATGKPILTPALESTVPNLYVAGTLIAGCEANVVFVENSREHGPLIVNDILAKM